MPSLPVRPLQSVQHKLGGVLYQVCISGGANQDLADVEGGVAVQEKSPREKDDDCEGEDGNQLLQRMKRELVLQDRVKLVC
jgi:hypothetical protein